MTTRRRFIQQSSCAVAAMILSRFALAGNNSPAEIVHSLTQQKMKDALYYKKTAAGAECELCPNFCILKEGKLSSCRTRIVKNGKLITLAYNNPCAIHIDPVEKKPLYHFLPGTQTYSIATAGCNLHCLNCQNWSISQVSPEETENETLTPSQGVAAAIKNKCRSISYTYTEPIVFIEYMSEMAALAKKSDIRNIMVTAGYINEKPLKDLCKVIDAANVDLKSFDNETYKKLNAGSLEPVLNTLKTFKSEGVWLEITSLIVPTWNDKTDMIKKMCDWLVKNGFEDTPLHFSRFFPQYKLTQLPPTPVQTLETAKDIAQKAGIKYVYVGNVSGKSGTDTVCPKCKKTVIARMGYKVTENNIVGGKCKFCSEKIAGVFE
jgi:pyruvate formate lyase activating enzyme